MHPFLLTKLTEASKSQKIDSKFSTKTKTKTCQNLNMTPPLVKNTGLKLKKLDEKAVVYQSVFSLLNCFVLKKLAFKTKQLRILIIIENYLKKY